MKTKRIMNYGELSELSRIVNEGGMGDYGISVVVELDDAETLRKVNEDYYYRTGNVDDGNGKPDFTTDEVEVSIGNIEIRYRVREKNETEEKHKERKRIWHWLSLN